MYAIKMNTDKSLVATIRTPLLVGEQGGDIFEFIVPANIDEISIKDHYLFLHYFLPGSMKYSEILLGKGVFQNEQYLKYFIKRIPGLKLVAGHIKIRLAIKDFNNNIILMSGELKIKISFYNECECYHPAHSSDTANLADWINSLGKKIVGLNEDSHTHENKTLLDNISEDDIRRWNNGWDFGEFTLNCGNSIFLD